jgi:hypothetical protein
MKRIAHVGVDYHVKSITIAVYQSEEKSFLETIHLNNDDKVITSSLQKIMLGRRTQKMESVDIAGDPVIAAEDFAARHSSLGFRLDFSLESLETEIDRLLAQPIFHRGREGSLSQEEARNEAAISAYVGETIRRLFQGRWAGVFHPDQPASNFYTSFVQFGSYRYWPAHYFAYRLTNWPQEGTFSEYLERLLPTIKEHLGECVAR